jgi:hypothetical protein
LTIETKILGMTGGLGNQLFQIAAARRVFGHYSFSVEWALGITNTNSEKMPEITDYELPREINFMEYKKHSVLKRKLVHLVLRRSSSARKFPKYFGFRMVEIFTSVSLRNFLGNYYKIIRTSNLNEVYVNTQKKRREYLIGFFHSNHWIDDEIILSVFHKFTPKSLDPYLVFLRQRAEVERPIIVHMRLGDYEKEEKFGILPSQYYKDALDLIYASSDLRNIWIFTNNQSKAEELFPKEYINGARWVPDFSESAVQVLEAMRLGSAFITGNSTFSWWAAKLSHEKSALVIAPMPWFKNGFVHGNLLPSNWITLNPW